MVQLGYLFLIIVQLIINLKNRPEAVEKVKPMSCCLQTQCSPPVKDPTAVAF